MVAPLQLLDLRDVLERARRRGPGERHLDARGGARAERVDGVDEDEPAVADQRDAVRDLLHLRQHV